MKLDFKTKALIRGFLANEDGALKQRMYEEFILDHKDEWNAWITNHKRLSQAATRKSIVDGAKSPKGLQLGITTEFANALAAELIEALEEIWAEMLITTEKEAKARARIAKTYEGIINPDLN